MRALRRHILAFTALLLMIAQGASFAHAASFGGEMHSHDGVLCDVALLEEDMEAALPAPDLVMVDAPIWNVVFETVAVARDVPRPPARAPPPRGPPA